jgi:uncharacterized protein YlbG (UPF0298 family)
LPSYNKNIYIINLDDSKPPFKFLYNLLASELEIIRTYINIYLTKEWIRRSINLVGALIFFVSKKDRILKLYINYRDLNKITIKDRYPFSFINKTLDRLINIIYYTKLNFKDAYYRIRIKKGDE